MGISKQNFHVVPHAQICVSKMKRDRRDNIQRFIIIFIISNFLKFMIEMLLDNVKVDNYKVSVKLNSYLVSRIKKFIKIVTDGTKIQLTFDLFLSLNILMDRNCFLGVINCLFLGGSMRHK